MISKLENVPATEILLYSSGAPLPDDLFVSQLPTLTIDVSVPLLGGELVYQKNYRWYVLVHSSLKEY